MSSYSLTLNNPLHTRLLAWMDERFPLINGLLFVFIYLGSAAISRYANQDGALSVSLIDLVNALVCWSFFLILRVFDEHKDYELDVKNHPQRVLQSGLITLNHLKVLAVVAIVIQVAWSLAIDNSANQVIMAWAIMFAWTSLMGKEFFCGEWLEKRLTLYAFSHMLVMVLVIWWLANLASSGSVFSDEIALLMAFAFFSGFAFEITRKTRGPEEERDTVDSYSKIFGPIGAAKLILALVTIMLVLQLCLMHFINSSTYWVGIALSLTIYAVVVKTLLAFIKHPTESGRGKNEGAIALSMLGGYGILISAVIVERGVMFSLI